MSFLEEGHLVGRYRVEAFLAEGGMGRIYRAVDSLLGRRVALKLLSDPGAPGGAAIARLLREARAAAALSHPNICAVFDVGEADGQPFIAMELVRGGSLRDRLADGTVGLAQRLRWLHELADALAAAHRAHLIHRDIKPDNVAIADDGRVRLLDFGIAKWDDRAEPAMAALTGPAGFQTQDGHVVGTAGYMAPEQATGGPVDARTDQFAWGVLAYEVLAGVHPFADGAHAEPRLVSERVPALPFGVAAIIARALARDPAARFADMDEIVALLQPALGAALARGAELAARGRAEAPTAAHGVARRSRRRALAAIAAAGVIAGGLAARSLRGRRAPGFSLVVSNVRRVTFGDGCEEFPSFLPGGRAVIYDGTDGAGHHVLYRLELVDGARPRAILPPTDPGRDTAATVSPDGARVAYLHNGAAGAGVMVARLDGAEPPRRIGAATTFPRWASDGRGLWIRGDRAIGLHDVATGAVLRTLALPAGVRALWIVGPGDGPVILQLNHGAAATPSGVAAFGADGALRWQRDEELEPGLALTPDGRHVIAARQALPGQSQLVAIPVDGSPPVSLASTGVVVRNGLDLSPDGRRLAWSTCRAVPRVAVIDPGGRAVPTLTQEADDAIAFAGIPGRRELAVVSGRTGRPRLWVMDPSGERAPRRIELGELSPREVAVSRDGARFAVSVPGAGIAVGALTGDAAPHLVTDHGGDAAPSFRRDGAALMFSRPGGDGAPRAMVVPVAGGPAVPVAGIDATEATASPVDDAIAYLPRGGGAPRLAEPGGAAGRPLSPALAPGTYRAVRWSPDGRHLLVQRGGQALIEIERATGAVARTLTAEPGEVLYSPSYGPAGPVVIRVRWQGNLYVADAALGDAGR